MSAAGKALAVANAKVEPPGVRAPELVDSLDESERLPWLELRLEADGVVIARGPLGAFVVMLGWEGSGKSSIVMQIGLVFARSGVVFIYVVTELNRAEVAARIVGIETETSWEDAYRGRVPREQRVKALAMPNFIVLADEEATLENLEKRVHALRENDPNLPIVVGYDYIQDIEIEGRDERAKVKAASRLLRRTAKRLKLFMIGLSQTSRAGREDLRSGDALGAETATKGAESSQIERDAYVLLALGNPQEQDDGSIVMDLSVGKARMRQGNQVHTLRYWGRTGRARIEGESRSATDVRKERESERSKKKRETIKRAIIDLVSKSDKALSKSEITERTEGNNGTIADAIKELIREQVLAHHHAAARYGHAPIWTPERIAAAAAGKADA